MNTALLNKVVPRIGRILRIYREKTRKNQGDIAEKAGISVSMLSQIERGIVSPSIDTLMAVCGVLDIDPSELFKKIASDTPVRLHRRGERLQNEIDGVRYEQLMTSMHPSYQAELFLLEVEPGKSTTFRGGGHEGVEMGYVAAGEAMLTIDSVEYPIGEGDSVYFNAHLPHQLSNRGSRTFRAIWSISPPHVDFLGTGETA
ncbi:MAG: helix-turn-helix transcriptional regulator [Chitinispirillaceae bacterium]|nr:helix-turn-helix transcriptional regulator [Chitinispirillaceae bacterium]